MPKLFLILVVFIPATSAAQIGKVMASGVEAHADYVYISGETNINCFECRYNKNHDDKYYKDFQFSYDKISGGTIKADLPVSEFECSNEIMYNDFRKLLDAEEYPYIKIEIDPSQIKNVLPGRTSHVELKVSLTIAGITKVQPVSCWISTIGNNSMSINGITTINIMDFQIEPPVKFLGLVKVKEIVTINFSFNFNVV